MFQNFLNIEEKNFDRNIYRVFSLTRLKEIYETRKITLVRPSLWDDPFENFLLNSIATTKDGSSVSFDGIRDSIYGQCWTLHRETDAIWRIYSQNKNGVKVRTTINKLYNTIYSQLPQNERDISLFIGQVEYLPKKEILSLYDNKDLKETDLLRTDGKGIIKTLLFKRREFSHEKEVRILYNDINSNSDSSDLIKFDVNPNALFDQIIFDPRMEDDIVEKATDLFKSNYAFDNYISKSSLYQVPKLNLRI